MEWAGLALLIFLFVRWVSVQHEVMDFETFLATAIFASLWGPYFGTCIVMAMVCLIGLGIVHLMTRERKAEP